MTVFQDQMAQLFNIGVVRLIAALLILIVGWLVALIVASVVRGIMQRTGADERLNQWLEDEEGKKLDVAQWISKGVYYLVLLFVLVAFFQVLGLTLITQPLNRLLVRVFEYAPRLIGAGLLLLVAWVVANVLKFIVAKGLRAARIDELLKDKVGIEPEKTAPLSEGIAEVVYWLVFLFFLPAILDALALGGLLAPVQQMVESILTFLPNIFAAAIILVIGWFGARIVQRIVTGLLAAAGVDAFSERAGISKALGKQTLSELLGLLVYVLILIPVLTAALDALALEAITRPAINVLNMVLQAMLAVFAAAIVLAVSFAVGRVVAQLVTSLLEGAGFDKILVKLGVAKQEPAEGERRPSEVVGLLVMVGIMLLATIESLRLLGFGVAADLVASFTVLVARVILGVVILGIGIYLANLASKTIRESGAAQAGVMAMAARVAILFLAGAIALREMGLANEIIVLAFGLLVGAAAVAVALAFGLGARDTAGRLVEEWLASLKSEEKKA